MDFDVVFFGEALLAAVRAVPRALFMVFCTLVFGTVLGTPVALVRFYHVPYLAAFFEGLFTVLRGIPYLIFLLTFYLVFGRYPDLDILFVAILAIGLCYSVQISESIRGALESIGREQFDAAYAVGHTGAQAFGRIILPQLIPAALPPLSNVFIWILKSLPAASMIGVNDILNSALSEATINYRYLEAYLAAGLIFWVLFIIAERIFLAIEKNILSKTTKGTV
ncbi:MAG: ABC transporter permease subunit [Spirochaetaceae bacterium]|jgi:L-cystine transport system permease protein|nr:ABC transporter permease subunit [Spirochaetaceae bacterium]